MKDNREIIMNILLYYMKLLNEMNERTMSLCNVLMQQACNKKKGTIHINIYLTAENKCTMFISFNTLL